MSNAYEDNSQTFLLMLSDTLRAQTGVEAVGNRATQLIAQRLGADRVYLVSLNPDDDTVVVTHETRGQNMVPLRGSYRSSDFPSAIQEIFERTIVYTDVRTDARLTELDRLSFAGLGAVGFMAASLRRGSETMIWAAGAISTQPRSWTIGEVALFEDAVERTWAAIERARAEAALRQSEQRNAFLLQLADTLRPLSSPLEIQYQAAQALGEFLEANRIGYAITQENEKLVAVTLHYLQGVPTIEGIYRYSDYGPQLLMNLQAGQTVIQFDIPQDASLSEAEKAAYARLQLGATVNVPLLKEGHLIAIFFVHFRKAHAWSTDEIALINETAERIWSSVERASMAEALRKSEEQFRLLGIASSDSIYKMSPDWTQMRQLIGKTFLANTHEANTSWLSAYIPSEDQPHTQQVIQEAIRTKSTFELEHRVRRVDGSVGWTFSRAIPVLDEQGNIQEWLGAASDITARKQAEVALLLADQRKDEFLAMLAHELRNPMSTLRSGLQILTITDGKDQTSRDTITMMSRQTNQLVRMVDDLLDVSRISQGKIELKTQRVNLVEVVAQAAESVQALYQEQGQHLHVDLPTSPTEVEGDSARLSQVVTNLLTNGARYTQEGGQVWLSLMHRGQEALIQVRDNGIGLEADQLKSIFELFVQVDNSLARSKGGLGLGLTLVKRLVELHGGWVEAQSEGVGKGSTFEVHLSTINAAPERTLKPEEGSSSHLLIHRILVIDDNTDAAFTLSILLKLKGYEVHVRHSGPQGVKAAEELHPGMILCDIGMPGMDGYATARLIRQQPWGKAMRLIALTGYGSPDDKQRAQEAGFNWHLVKPVDIDELHHLLVLAANEADENFQ